MILEQITLYHIRMFLQTPFETSFGRSETRDCIVIETKSGGITGYGECVADRDPGYSYETVATAWHILSDFLIPAVIGVDIASPADYQKRVSFVRGHLMAKAGIEMALWDLLGKIHAQSLRSLMGGAREYVEVGVSVGIQNSVQTLLNVVAGYQDQGYRRVKLKIKPGRDVNETRAVRHAFPDLRLQVDANSAYTLDSASILGSLDDLSLLLIEQPLAEDDLWQHSRLQAQLITPICLDESILSSRHAQDAIEMRACRIINIKAGRVGGLSQAQAIHDLCLGRGIPVWCGGMLETGIGRASNLALASLPGFVLPGDISATERYYFEDITEQRFTLNSDSTITVPDLPGLGVTIDHNALTKVTMAKRNYDAGEF